MNDQQCPFPRNASCESDARWVECPWNGYDQKEWSQLQTTREKQNSFRPGLDRELLRLPVDNDIKRVFDQNQLPNGKKSVK